MWLLLSSRNKMDEEKKQARQEAYQDVKMYIANDWELVEETPEYFLLKRNTQGFGMHMLIAFLTIWWTFGVANVLYWYLSRQTKKILK